MATRPPSTNPDATRMRAFRTHARQTRRTLIDLATLGAYLATLDPEDLARFAGAFGEDLIARARIAAAAAARSPDGPELVRDEAS